MNYILRSVIFCLFFLSCSQNQNSCIKCHKNIKPPDKNHVSCIQCHGGNPLAYDNSTAHIGLIKKGPSIICFKKLCGKCHLWEYLRINSSQMATNLGMINRIQKIWEGDSKNVYSVIKQEQFDSKGRKINIKWIGELDNLGAELYRKFCASCHLGYPVYANKFNTGCFICHMEYSKKNGYVHRLTATPSTDVCLICHMRSGRIGLSYTGLYEANNMVPTSTHGPKYPLRGGRSLLHIDADVHYKAGMDCIDCHTSRDVMGDGYLYSNKDDQVEISCTDCHGDGDSYPRVKEIERESYVFVEAKNYKKNDYLHIGTKLVLTKKERMYSNVYMDKGKVYVIGKRSGKKFECPIITKTKEHTIYGHKRLKCYVCHTRITPQCFGCHTYYFKNIYSYDKVKQKYTHGRFLEKEDFREPNYFILGVDKNNKITTLTPGCETYVYVKNKDKWIKSGYVSKYKGKRQFRFAPIFSHNTSKNTLDCIECHANPYILGFGKGNFILNGQFKNIYMCAKELSLDGLLCILKNGKIVAHGAVIGQGARPFTSKEIKRILKVNQCLVCHNNQYEIFKDPVDYSRINTCINLYRQKFAGKDTSKTR